jgi:hypothetical protein
MRFFDEGKAATCRDVAPLIARSAAVVHRVSIPQRLLCLERQFLKIEI